MKIFFLAIDWSLVRLGFVFLCMGIFAIIIETIVMLLFKFDRFGKSFLDSIMANIGTVLLVIFLALVFNKSEFKMSQVSELIILYCIISLFEAWIIKLLNRQIGWGRIIVTSFIMNLLSFASLYVIFTKFLASLFSA